jgi:hypothetical protein
MGGSALRGLAFGKPVVVQGVGRFARLFDEETCAYFFEYGFYGYPSDDCDTALELAVGGLLSDDARRKRLSEFGRQIVLDRYSLPVAADRLEAIYREALREVPSLIRRSNDAAYLLLTYFGMKLLPTRLYSPVRTLARSVVLGKRQATSLRGG